ncbi:hypothetical protein PINS_up021836 [Pythium insidiosum]|nr:hypothetical protein PINS_up021836 [Pythium insidiosum]
MWSWSTTALAAAVAGCSALAAVALVPPIKHRIRHPAVAAQIPLRAYVSFDVAVRFRSFLHRLGGVSSKLEPIADVEQLAPGVIRILGQNPGRMTLRGTNTYLLGDGPTRLLLDASDGNDGYMRNLLDCSGVLRVEYMPGHCADHVCFLLEDGPEIALFSGDCILGEGSCVFDSLRDLMTSLRRLREIAPKVIYPAHGPVVHKAMDKINEYITHRQQREDEIVTAMRARAVDKHLDKLVHDGVVRRTPATWTAPVRYELSQ